MLTDEDTYTDEKDPIFVPNEKASRRKVPVEESPPLKKKHRKNNIFAIVSARKTHKKDTDKLVTVWRTR
jgi:hypothetical protein